MFSLNHQSWVRVRFLIAFMLIVITFLFFFFTTELLLCSLWHKLFVSVDATDSSDFSQCLQ